MKPTEIMLIADSVDLKNKTVSQISRMYHAMLSHILKIHFDPAKPRNGTKNWKVAAPRKGQTPFKAAKCAKESFRTLRRGEALVTVCCPKNDWMPKAKRCKSAMKYVNHKLPR